MSPSLHLLGRYRAQRLLAGVVLACALTGPLVGCNGLLGLDAVAPPADAPHDGTPDGTPDGPPDGSPDAPVAPPPPVIQAPGNGTTVADLTPTVSGTCVTGAVVRVTDNSGAQWCEASCTAGEFAYAPSADKTQATHSISATQQNVGGLSAPSASIVFTINTNAAIITSPTHNGYVATTTPTVSGTCVVPSTVTITWIDNEGTQGSVCAATCTNGGEFSCQATAPLSQGGLTLRATQNAPATVTNISIVVDSIAPSAPTFIAPTPAQNAYIATSQPTVSVGCEVGATVKVFQLGGSEVASATCNGANIITAQTIMLAQGSNSLYAQQTDAAGNASANSTTRTFTVDTIKPVVPTISAPADGANVCVEAPVFSGNAPNACEAGATVTVFTSKTGSDVAVCSATCVGGGFTCTAGAPMSLGLHPVRARQTDLAGNIDDGGAYRDLTIFPTGANDDGDSAPDGCDNCPHIFNTQSFNVDGDGLGDACDADDFTPQSIVKFYPVSNAMTEFTNDGWINSGLLVSAGRLIPQQSVGTLSKTFPTAVLGEVVLGDYSVAGATGDALQISLATDQSAVPSCRLGRDGEQNMNLVYLINEIDTETVATSPLGDLRQRVVWGTHENVCDAAGQMLDGPATQGNNNFQSIWIDLHHINVSIDYVLLIKND